MFRALFGGDKQRKKRASQTRPSSGLEQTIFATLGANSIPPMPASAQRAFQLSTDPNTDARDFVELVESDEGLAARVVKVANSVFFDRGGQKTTTVEDAVRVIGLSELRALLNATTLSEIFPSRSPLRAQFWANDVATALIARELARAVLPSKSDIAFLSGLMHDVGKLLMLQRAADKYGEVVTLVKRTGMPFVEAESQVFIFNHCEVGVLIAERWRFADEVRDVIATHHTVPVTDSAPSVAKLVRVADGIAHILALGVGHQFGQLKEHFEELLAPALPSCGIRTEAKREKLEQYARLFAEEYDLYAGRQSNV